MNLPRKYCRHGDHEAPADTFRWLPGVKIKREVCQRCYDKIMAERERVKQELKIGDIAAKDIPF